MARSDRYTRKILTSGDRSKWSDLYVSDSNKIILGADGDLQIYHDGNDNHIEATSALNIATANSGVAVKIGHTTSEVSVSDNFTITGNTTANGTVQINNTLTIGVDDTGHDVKFFGATSGRYMLWDESSNALHLQDETPLKIGAGTDLQIKHNGTNNEIANLNGTLQIIQHVDDGDIQFYCDDGSGGTTAYITLDGSATRTAVHKEMRVDDAVLFSLGASADLKLFHNGTDSYIENDTGDLYIKQGLDDKDIIFQSDDGSGGIATYFYLDGSLGRTVFPDNSRLVFGSSSDFDMRHYPSNGMFMNNMSDDFVISNYADDKDIIFKSDDGSGGVTAYLTLDGSAEKTVFTKDVRFNDGIDLNLGAANDFILRHDGSNSWIINQQVGDLYIRQNVDDKDIIFQCDDGSGGSTTYMTIDGSDTDIKVHKNFEIEKTLTMQHTADPSDPATGHSVMWSDTSGNLKVKINVGGSVVTRTLATGTD